MGYHLGDYAAYPGACGNINNQIAFSSPKQEAVKCSEISLRSNWAWLLSVVWIALFLCPAFAQETSGPDVNPGLTFDEIRDWTQPIADLFAFAIAAIVFGWRYIMTNSPAAVLLSATAATVLAARSIASQREMTRLRETFSAIDSMIKDKDFIEARAELRKIKTALAESNGSIATFQNPKTDEEIRKASGIRTILNNYENLALGVRYSILDEDYLYRWTKTVTLDDWNYLLPLVTAYRSSGQPSAYMEFEGLATSWLEGKAYATGKKIKSPNRRTKIH